MVVVYGLMMLPLYPVTPPGRRNTIFLRTRRRKGAREPCCRFSWQQITRPSLSLRCNPQCRRSTSPGPKRPGRSEQVRGGAGASVFTVRLTDVLSSLSREPLHFPGIREETHGHIVSPPHPRRGLTRRDLTKGRRAAGVRGDVSCKRTC